jgi:hypothetical protein
MAKRDRDPTRTLERRRAWLIGWALFCCYAYFFYVGGNWNVESHYAQTFALAEHGRLIIDDYPFLPRGGGDAAFYRGHFYSDKFIGPSLVSAPIYRLLRETATASELSSPLDIGIALRLTNILTNALPSALLGALLYLFLAELGLTAQLRVWLVFAYGLGTLAFPYSTVFFGHQLAAVAVAGAFMLLWRQRAEWSHRRAIAAGALAGFAAISDAMGVFVAGLLGVYAIWLAVAFAASSRQENLTPLPPLRARGFDYAQPRPTPSAVEGRRGGDDNIGGKPGKGGVRFVARLAAFALPALAVFSIQLIANWISFGSPLAFPHLYHAQAAFRARHAAGLFGIHLPQLYPLYQLAFGPWRGLFYGSPVLLFALPGFFLMARPGTEGLPAGRVEGASPASRLRPEAILIAATWLLVLLLSSGYENWTTGSAYGPRYQIVVLPLLVIAAAPAAARWPLIFKLLASISISFMSIVTAQTPFIPEDLRSPLAAAIAEFARGNLQHGNLGLFIWLQGTISLAPLIVVVAAFLLALRMSGGDGPETRQPARRRH